MLKYWVSLLTWVLLAIFCLLLMAGELGNAFTLFVFVLLPLLLIRGVIGLVRFLRTPLGSHGYTVYHMVNINKKNDK